LHCVAFVGYSTFLSREEMEEETMNRLAFAIRSGRLSCALCLAALMGAAACGGESVEEVGEEVPLGFAAQELAASEWVNGWNQLSRADSSAVAVTGQAVGCETRYGSAGGQTIFRRDVFNHIAMAWKSYSPFTPWTTIGSSSFTFSTEPACATFDGAVDGSNPSRQFAVVAKGSGSNRYWYATWLQGEISTTFGEPPTAGGLVRDWQLVGNEAFASAPAATVHNGKLLVLGRKSDNQLMMRSYPLNLGNQGDPTAFGGPWTTTNLPILPTSWGAIGDPAMIHAPLPAAAMIVVRAGNTITTRLFRTMTSNGTSFSPWTEIPTGAIGATNTIVSDPSIEIGRDRSSAFRYTVHVRAKDGKVWQASTNPGTITFQSFVKIPWSDTLTEGPFAIGGNLGGDSAHVVFAKKSGSNNLFMTASVPNVE
jgi:hypothetical protein